MNRDLAERLSRVESRNVTSLRPVPPFWTEAAGATVVDADGNSYLDFTGAFGVALAGHRHPRIIERIRAQADRLVHGMGDVHPPAIKVEFLEALAEMMPWSRSRTVLGITGSDAVEAALKTAQLATGRTGIVAFEGSYHGTTLGALAATHREHFRRPFAERLADHVRFAPFPTSDAAAGDVLAAVEGLLAGWGRVKVAAVVVEPIQGRAGVRVPPPGFLADLAERTRAAGALFIADEVFTGMGRTGHLLACDHEGIRPDLICLGKALGGGMPLSACCGSHEVMDAWPPSSGEAIHTSTFLGHPVSCAGGLAFLELVRSEDLPARAKRLGNLALDQLAADLGAGDGVADVRGRGLMLGVELERGRVASPAAAVAERARRRGLIVLPAGELGEVVELTPPATLEQAELENGLGILVAAIRSLASR